MKKRKKKLSKRQKIKLAKRKRKVKEGRKKFGSDSARYNVKQLLKAYSKIGKSKRESEAKGEDGIFGIETLKDNIKTAEQFTEFMKKKYNIKYLNMFRVEHAIDFLETKAAEGASYGYLQNLESRLINLSKAMQYDSVFRHAQFHMPDERIYPTLPLHLRISRVDRSYSQTVAESILQALEDAKLYKLANSVYLALNVGLRAEEICLIEKRHFVYYPKENKYRIEIHPNDSSHVTKGNRFRYVWINSEHNERISNMLKGLDNNEQLIGDEPRNISTQVSNYIQNKLKFIRPTYVKTMHGFRHRFARNRLQEYLPQTEQHQKVFQQMMNNKFSGHRIDKGLKSTEKNIYEDVKKAVDKVHSDLGHGKGRWDLAMIYLS